MPFGPSVDRTAFATAFAAAMLLFWASCPRFRVVPCLRIIIGCPPSCCDISFLVFYFVIHIPAKPFMLLVSHASRVQGSGYSGFYAADFMYRAIIAKP
jgi:hypothetical protein